eukprot:tig00020904_g15188.t1
MADVSEEAKGPAPAPLRIVYCGVCGFPPEYCENGPHFDRCKPWLMQHCPEMYPGLKGDASVDKQMEKLAVSEGGDGGEGSSSAGASKPEEKPAEPKKKKKGEDPMVTIKKENRNKRKFVTTVTGLDKFGVRLQDAAKLFAKKFSCGASVVKGPVADEIDIQGDVKEDVVDIVLENFDVPEDRIFFIEDGGKKVKAR